MRIDVLTLFPGMFPGPLAHSILGRAGEAGLLAVFVHDLRPYAEGKHRVTDEPPFGGGGGMVMKPEPIFAGVEALRAAHGPGRVILLSPAGSLLTPEAAARLAKEDHLILLCGRYEGVDQRVADHLADEELSIGDYVLSGGELPALVHPFVPAADEDQVLLLRQPRGGLLRQEGARGGEEDDPPRPVGLSLIHI